MNKQFLLQILLLLLFASSFSKNIYVSKSGNDNNAGTLAQPYLTITKAANVALAGDQVYIRAGEYEETLRPTNSGNNGNPIVFQSYQNEKVIISAMQALNGWTPDGDGRYKTTTTWDLGQRNFVMNGTTALDLARWPNNTDGDRMTINSLRNDGGSQDNVSVDAFLTDADIPNWNWSNGGSIMFYGDRPGSGWTTWRAWIKSQSTGRVNFDAIKDQSWIITAHPPGDFGDYFLEGIKEALDYENEWYFNSSNKTLFLKLPGDAVPVDGEVKMARREKTVDLSNRNNIEIRNLALFGGNVEISGNNNKLYGITSLYGSMTRGITREFNSKVNAINVNWGSQNTTIEKCEVGFGDGTGIWDSGSGTIIDNCYVHDFDFLGSYDAPVMIRGQNGAKLINSTVTRGGRDALQIISKGSEVAWNDISRSNLIADDCALLYTIGDNLNMDIHHNWFHDAQSRGNLKKAAGIYLDNDAGEVRVYRNVVWNVEWTNVQINWNGNNIDIFNNTLMKADGGTMGAWHKAGTQFSNVKVWNNITDKQTSDQGGNQETEVTWEPQSDKQNNLVDKTSFVDHLNNDYRLKPNTTAIDFGRLINGYTDNFVGTAPDVGAYELGDNWTPGIDWDRTQGAADRCYGLPGEECTNNSSPITEDVGFAIVPTSLAPGDEFTFDIAYSANQTRDLVVEMKSPTDTWLGLGRTTVSMGTGTAQVTITLPNNAPIGDDYKFNAWIVPVGADWMGIIDSENQLIDIKTPVIESLSLVNPPTEVSSNNTYSFDFEYTTSQSRDVVIELKDKNNVWLGNVRVNVPEGSGLTSGTVTLANALPLDQDYQLITFMVPVGTDWQSTIVGDNSTFNVVTITSVYDSQGNETFVYPNPVSDILHLSNEYEWELRSSYSQSVLKGTSQEINMTFLKSGVYFLLIENDIVKIIKE